MFLDKSKYYRRFFVGDIHGTVKTLKALVEKLDLQKTDLIVFLGDYINKGPDSLAVIDYLIELKEKLPNLFFIRGNHEQNLLDTESKKDTLSNFYFVKQYRSDNLVDLHGNFKPRVINFIKNTVFYIEFEDAFAVHAGFNFSSPDFLKDTKSMIEIRNWQIPNPPTKKRIIFGHQPVGIRQIKYAVHKRKRYIPLDNGCVYRFANFNKNRMFGRLCALNLDEFKLIYQLNIDL